MTPEDVESRLHSLRTPAPPERLRVRCLRGRSRFARPRAAFAVAASLLVVGLSVWLIALPEPPPRPPNRILPPPAEATPFSDDPVLKEKVDRLLRDNPGKGVLVIRVKELRDGAFLPVTQGFRLKIYLEDSREEPDPLRNPDGPSASVDLDGTLLFVKSPGVFRGSGYSDDADGRLKDLCFRWEYKDLALNPGGVLLLPEASFAPWISWAAPAEGTTLSLKEEPRITWAPYPELVSVKVEIQRVQRSADAVSWSGHGDLRRDAPKDSGVRLSEVLSAARPPLAVGDRVALNLIGYDARGRELTRSKDKLQFVLGE